MTPETGRRAGAHAPPFRVTMPRVSDPAPSAIVISDAGLPAVVGAAIEAERAISGGGGGVPALMPWPTDPVLAECQYAAAKSHARFLRLALLDAPRLCAADISASTGLIDTLGLLAAVELARTSGATRVVWPVHYHADDATLPGWLDQVASAVDRALLTSRLALLDSGAEVTIETPLVDLTDRQTADLVVDLDAPAYLAWWWRRRPEPPAEALAVQERRAWLDALRDAGWVQADPAAHVVAGSRPTTVGGE